MDAVLIDRPPVREDEILGLNIPMRNRSVVASGHGLAHLSKQRSDQTETGTSANVHVA